MIRKGTFALLALVLWLSAVTGIKTAPPMQMRWLDGEVSPAALDLALDKTNHLIQVSIWRTETVDGKTVATYTGDPYLLTGGIMQDGNAYVCAVSEQFAFDTWKSNDVVALSFNLKGKKYVVGGVFRVGVADIILAWDGTTEGHFNQMAVLYPEQEYGMQYLKALDFAAIVGMGKPDEVLDAPLIYSMAAVFALLPGWVFILLVIVYQWRILRGAKIMHVSVRGWAIVISLVGMFFITGIYFVPPKWILPTRWADFTHWRKIVCEVGGRIHLFMRAEHNPLNSHDLYTSLCVVAQGILCVAILVEIRGGKLRGKEMDSGYSDRGTEL